MQLGTEVTVNICSETLEPELSDDRAHGWVTRHRHTENPKRKDLESQQVQGGLPDRPLKPIVQLHLRGARPVPRGGAQPCLREGIWTDGLAESPPTAPAPPPVLAAGRWPLAAALGSHPLSRHFSRLSSLHHTWNKNAQV